MPCCTKRPRRRWGAALFSAALSLFAVACEPASEVGLDVVPDDVPSTATYVPLSATAITVLRDDSVLTANKDNALTGTLPDARVGLTTASSYWQVRPLSTNPSAPPLSPTADSLVLTYGFTQFYGSANGTQVIEAYELSEGFAAESAYYAESRGLTLGPKLGETTFKLRYAYEQKDSVLLTPWVISSTTKRADSTRVLQPLRIRVGTDLKERLLSGIGDPTKLATLATIQSVLKGVALRPASESAGTAIINLSPRSVSTKMVLYYHASGDAVQRTFTFSLGAEETERHFTKISTTYNGDHLARLAAQDTVAADALNGLTTYLQGGLELGTRIKLNGADLALLRAQQARIAVNRAELVIPVKPYAAGVYPVPAQAYLVEVDAQNRPLKTAGQLRVIQANGEDPTGTRAPAVVTYDASQRVYRVLLTTYFDALLHDKLLDQKGAGFLLLPTLPGVRSLGLNRALIDAAPSRIQLKVYYSELN